MAQSRSDLKKKVDELNASVPADSQIQYKANSNIDTLNEIIEKLEAIPAETPADENAVAPDAEDAVQDGTNAPETDESNSDDESVAVEDETSSDADMDVQEETTESDDEGEDIKMKQCAGNHSAYPATQHNFPTKWGGRYSREYLISKRLLAK